MKRIAFFSSLLTVFFLIFLFVVSNKRDTSITLSTSPTPITRYIPSRLKIPKLNIDVSVEEVGLDDEKRMDIPKDPLNVAWYQLGVKPGENGSAVIAGHFDLPGGTPGVFYSLSTLQNGEKVIIVDSKGQELTFNIVATKKYPDNVFPIDEVFFNTDSARLNLITCDGVFNSDQKNYSDRLVVFTQLED